MRERTSGYIPTPVSTTGSAHDLLGARGQRQRPTFRHRVDRVEDHIDEDFA